MDSITPDPQIQVPSERERYIDGLRVLASVLESNPDLPLPYEGHSSTITFHFLGAPKPREAMAQAARLIPCSWRKEVSDENGDYPAYFDLLGEVAGLKVRLVAFRNDVCRRIVTGTRKVTEKVKDPDKLAEVPEIQVTRVVEDVEWDCGSLLAPRPLADATPLAVSA